MSATTLTEARLSYGGVLKSELLKLRSRAMLWVTGIALGLWALLAVTSGTGDIAKDPLFGTESRLFAGVMLAWIMTTVYAAVATTSEWSTGQYRATFAVVPRTQLWLAAKASAAAIYAAIVAVLGVVIAAAATLPSSLGAGGRIVLTDWDLWRAFLGVVAVFALSGVMATAIGAIVRATGIAVIIIVTITFILPFATLIFGAEWAVHISAYLPSGTADVVINGPMFGPALETLPLVPASIVLVAWAAAPYIAAWQLMSKRDA